MTTKQPPQNERRVLDMGALRALGHPMRVKIYEAIGGRGPQTASTLAAFLGESSGATSYHLRALAKHGLIEEDPERRSGRERWWRRVPGGIEIYNRSVKGSPAGEAVMQMAVTELLRHRYEESLRFFTSGIDKESPEWNEASASLTHGIPMTASQTRELISDIMSLIDAAADKYRDQTGEGVRHVTVRNDIFPLAAIDASKETSQ